MIGHTAVSDSATPPEGDRGAPGGEPPPAEPATAVAELSAAEKLRTAYRDVIQFELSHEDERKKSLEQRGITIITSSSAIAGLLFAVSAFVSKTAKINSFTPDERWPIKVSVVVFIGAAFLGLVTNIPFLYGNIRAMELSDLYLSADGTTGLGLSGFREKLDAAYIDILFRRQRSNWWKAEILLLGFFAEIVAVVFIALAIYRILNAALL